MTFKIHPREEPAEQDTRPCLPSLLLLYIRWLSHQLDDLILHRDVPDLKYASVLPCSAPAVRHFQGVIPLPTPRWRTSSSPRTDHSRVSGTGLSYTSSKPTVWKIPRSTQGRLQKAKSPRNHLFPFVSLVVIFWHLSRFCYHQYRVFQIGRFPPTRADNMWPPDLPELPADFQKNVSFHTPLLLMLC